MPRRSCSPARPSRRPLRRRRSGRLPRCARRHPWRTTCARSRARRATPPAQVLVLSGDIVTHRRRSRALIANPHAGTRILAGGRRRSLAFRVPGAARTAGQRRVCRTTPCAAPTARSSACSRAVPGDVETLAAAAERLAALVADVPRGVAGGARPQERALAGALVARRRAARRRAATTSPGPDEPEDADDAPERGRRAPTGALRRGRGAAARRASPRRPRTPSRCCSSASCARTSTSRAIYLRQLFWARPLSADAAAARRRAHHATTTRTACCSTRPSRAPTASSRRSSSARTRSTSRAGRRAAGSRPTRSRPSRCCSACSRRRRSPPASAGASSPARCCCRSASRPTASTASSPATRGSSPSSARGWTRCSTAPRSTSRSPAWRSARSHMGDAVWLLACAAITLQTVRHIVGLLVHGGRAPGDRASRRRRRSSSRSTTPARRPRRARAARAARRGRPRARPGVRSRRAHPVAPGSKLDRPPALRWVKRMAAFPIGERFAVISITAALFTPRVTFIAWLAWGGLALVVHPGRARAEVDPMSAAAAAVEPAAPPDPIAVYRDDGPLARALGALGRALPLPGPDRCAARRARAAARGRDRHRRRRRRTASPRSCSRGCCWPAALVRRRGTARRSPGRVPPLMRLDRVRWR